MNYDPYHIDCYLNPIINDQYHLTIMIMIRLKIKNYHILMDNLNVNVNYSINYSLSSYFFYYYYYKSTYHHHSLLTSLHHMWIWTLFICPQWLT
jgi:hypothetical protein